LLYEKTIFFFLFLIALIIANAQRTQTLFDENWKFYRGVIENGEKQNLNDNDWRTVATQEL